MMQACFSIVVFVTTLSMFAGVVSSEAADAEGDAERAFREENAGKVITVRGPVAADALGVTLPHEHFFIDLSLPENDPARWERAGRKPPSGEADLRYYAMKLELGNRAEVLRHLWRTKDPLILNDFDMAVNEAGALREAGGGAVVDVTTQGLGRDPERLLRLSKMSGLNIVMGAGWYREGWRPADFGKRSIESLTDEIVSDIIAGVGGSGVRAGIIGEIPAMNIGTGPDTNDVRQLRAAARASVRTGAAITLHQWVGDGTGLMKTLDILEEEGADLSRVIVGHVGGDALSQMVILERAIARGATLEFDLLGVPFLLEEEVLDTRGMSDAIMTLIAKGHVRNILLSQDVCTKVQVKKYGGNGYDYVLTDVVPYLRANGVSEADIRRLIVENPASLLAIKPTDASNTEN